MYFWARDYTHAIEQANKTLAIDSKYSEAEAALALSNEQLGNYTQAAYHYIKYYHLKGWDAGADELSRGFESSGYRGLLRAHAKRVEARGLYYYAAQDYAVLHEKDAAFTALEKVFTNRAGARSLKVDPRLDSIRSDPRYTDILRRVGLPQ